jgi:RimJ/RimL family protein N-acetyltransferase
MSVHDRNEQPHPAADATIRTATAALTLRPLTAVHAPIYFEVLDRNRAHLSQHGDYQDEANATEEWVVDHLGEHAPDRYGIWLDQHLIGRIDLVHVEPPRYGLGYWLSHDATHRGYATVACGALIDFARTRRGATDIFAGVTHGNSRSVAVLERLHFEPIADLGTYTRYHLQLDPA